MEQASLPLNFYCRNARLYLKKAAFCKKSRLLSDELSHLRKFETLVASTIPAHPQFAQSTREKQVAELQDCLSDCRKRIQELQAATGEKTDSYPTYKKPPKSPKSPSIHKKGKMSSSRGPPPDSPISSRRPGDSPSKKQQSWGIWTANPQHDSQGSNSSPLGFGGFSPPSSTKRALLKGKKPAAGVKEPIVVPALPLRPSSPDQRLQAMIGGCALLASQLQPSGDEKYDQSNKSAADPGSSTAFEAKARSPNFQIGGTSKRSVEWLLAPPKGHHNTGERKDLAMAPHCNVEGYQKTPEKNWQRFRFASQFLEKRLKDRMNNVQRPCPDTDEDGSASSPAKVRTSSDRLTRDTLLHEEEGSSAEESAGPGASSSTLEMFAKHLNTGLDPSSITGRLQRMYILDHDDNSTERSHMISSTDDIWARKLVPVVEQKLCHDMLRPHSSSHKATPRSNRKKTRKRGVLGVMDDVIRQAVDSDSSPSNITSPHLLGSGQDSLSEIKKRIEGTSEQEGLLQGLQAEALEAKITSLQNLVGELRDCIEGFTTRVEEEGEKWQSEMHGLEKDLHVWREDTENELMGMKTSIKDEVQKMMDEVRRGLSKVERLLEDTKVSKESSKQKSEIQQQQQVEGFSTNMDFIKKQMESLVASMKVDVMFELKEKIEIGLRRDLDVFELGIAKQFEGMKKDMESTLAESEKLRRSERQQVEAFIDEKMERRLSQRMEIVSGGKERVIADMKNDLRLLWAEVDLLSKGREEIKDNVEQLANIAHEAKQSIGKEQGLLKSENGSLKKQLQYFKKESMEVRANIEDFKKEIELEMDDIRSSMEKVKVEGEGMKKLIDKMVESDELGRNKGGSSKANNSNNEGIHERMLIMEKVEGISQLYLGGLEDVRSELLSFKLECQDHMDELEVHCADLSRWQQEQESNCAGGAHSKLPLRELVLDGLESRVSHLESKLEQHGNLEEARLMTLAAIEKDREQTNAALDNAAAAAQKADELVSEMVGSFSSEIANMVRQSHEIQESLATEREAATASAGEMKRMSEDMEKEMHIAMVVISEAKMKGLKTQEGIEKEISILKGSIVLEKEAAAVAAANAIAAAAKAEAALVEICKTQRESLSISEDIAEAAGHAHMNYSKQLDSHIKEWRNLMLDEVTRARSFVEGIEEEKRRLLSTIIPAEGSAMASHHEEKPVSQEDFDQHIKKTQDTLANLERTVRELSASIESESATRQAESEQQDDMVKHEIKDLRQKVEEAFMRLDEVLQCNARSDNNMNSLHTAESNTEVYEREQALRQGMQNLESKISETAAVQADMADKVTECWKKVRKLETMQLNTASSVEEVHTSTGDLQKSATMWLQKYDAAARLLQELEKRILTLENGFPGGNECADERLDHVDKGDNMAPAQKERLINLYNELSGFIQRMRAHEGGQDDGKGGDSWMPYDTRLVSLETRVAQVESETFSNLRILDAKMEDFSVGVQTALEGASMAESKCSALGGELVKLFRMIVTTRKESPSKMMMMMADAAADGLSTEQQQQQQQHQHHHHHQQHSRTGRPVGVKSKGQPACNYCKKAAMKGGSGDLIEGGRGDMRETGHNHAGIADGYPTTAEGNKTNTYNNETSDIEQRSPIAMERSLKVCAIHGKHSPQHHMATRQETHHENHTRDVSPTSKITRQHRERPQKDRDFSVSGRLEEPGALETMGRRAPHDGRIFEGKLPITLDERRVENARKLEGAHAGSGKSECQLTNIRLEAGKVHVNVSHRPPSSLTGARLIKRGDAISAQP